MSAVLSGAAATVSRKVEPIRREGTYVWEKYERLKTSSAEGELGCSSETAFVVSRERLRPPARRIARVRRRGGERRVATAFSDAAGRAARGSAPLAPRQHGGRGLETGQQSTTGGADSAEVKLCEKERPGRRRNRKLAQKPHREVADHVGAPPKRVNPKTCALRPPFRDCCARNCFSLIVSPPIAAPRRARELGVARCARLPARPPAVRSPPLLPRRSRWRRASGAECASARVVRRGDCPLSRAIGAALRARLRLTRARSPSASRPRPRPRPRERPQPQARGAAAAQAPPGAPRHDDVRAPHPPPDGCVKGSRAAPCARPRTAPQK
jgi:hypothetical protein